MKKLLNILLILTLFSSCTSIGRFGKGVDITFDPRTIGMQIDDTIMQKNLSARLALTDKKYFLSIQSKVMDGRIFLSGKVKEPEEKIKSLTGREEIRAKCAEKLKSLLKEETGQEIIREVLFTKYLYH